MNPLVVGLDGIERLRGHTSIDVTVWCGTCDNHLQTDFSYRSKAVEHAKQFGWVFRRKWGWVCPECWSKLKEKQ